MSTPWAPHLAFAWSLARSIAPQQLKFKISSLTAATHGNTGTLKSEKRSYNKVREVRIPLLQPRRARSLHSLEILWFFLQGTIEHPTILTEHLSLSAVTVQMPISGSVRRGSVFDSNQHSCPFETLASRCWSTSNHDCTLGAIKEYQNTSKAFQSFNFQQERFRGAKRREEEARNRRALGCIKCTLESLSKKSLSSKSLGSFRGWCNRHASLLLMDS